jgi:hypothetical protein
MTVRAKAYKILFRPTLRVRRQILIIRKIILIHTERYVSKEILRAEVAISKGNRNREIISNQGHYIQENEHPNMPKGKWLQHLWFNHLTGDSSTWHIWKR